jgi:hypothetical protein
MDRRGIKRQIDFTAMEYSYLNMDKNRLISEQAKFIQTKISSRANFDMPSNKLNKVPSHKKYLMTTHRASVGVAIILTTYFLTVQLVRNTSKK